MDTSNLVVWIFSNVHVAVVASVDGSPFDIYVYVSLLVVLYTCLFVCLSVCLSVCLQDVSEASPVQV